MVVRAAVLPVFLDSTIEFIYCIQKLDAVYLISDRFLKSWLDGEVCKNFRLFINELELNFSK